MAVFFADEICIDPATLAEECDRVGIPYGEWRGRANRFYLPSGSEPGMGDILLTRKQLDRIDQTKSHELRFFDKVNGGEAPLARVHIVAAQCVTPGKPGDENAVYHVRVADIRRLWPLYVLDSGFNIPKTPGNSTSSADSSGGSTWAQVWAAIWEAFPAGSDGSPKGVMPTLPDDANREGSPHDLSYWGMTVADGLASLLQRLGYVLTYDPLKDVFTLADGSGEQRGLEDELDTLIGKRLHDGEPIFPTLGRIPSKVRVLFPKRPESAYGNDPWFAIEKTVEESLPGEKPKGVVAGSVVVVRDDLFALMAAVDCVNETDLDARATARAKSYFRQALHGDGYTQLVYSGIHTSILPGPEVSAVIWEDRGGGLKTEIVRRPMRDTIQAWPVDDKDKHWRLTEHVWVYESVEGVTPPTGATYKPCQVEVYNPSLHAWHKLFDCWYRAMDGQTPVVGRHLCRYAGMLGEGGEQRPLYIGGCCPDGSDGPGAGPGDDDDVPYVFPRPACIPNGTPYRDTCSVFTPNPTLIPLEVTITSTAGTCSDLPGTAANVTCNVLGTFPLEDNNNTRYWSDDPGSDTNCNRHCFWMMSAGPGDPEGSCSTKGFAFSLYYKASDGTFSIRKLTPPGHVLGYGGPPSMSGIIPLSTSPLHISVTYVAFDASCGGAGTVTLDIVEA